jgi:hypothetical protein
MELALNLGWLVLAVLLCGIWMRQAPQDGPDRRMQLVALALVILILFPVISVTDDILTVQNPAETDCCQRRDHACASEHSALQAAAVTIVPFFAGLPSDSIHYSVLGTPLVSTMEVAVMDSIQNRPPPSA